MMQTIFAQASARGKAGVSVIRVSGPDAMEVARRLVGSVPSPGAFALRSIRAENGELLDRSLVLVFKEPASFTGEDVVEFQLHGSPAVVNAVETAIAATGLARIALAGEFTQRALMNDMLDLAQVEGLSDLVAAETEAQRKQAMRVFTGGLSRKTEMWRSSLLRAVALLEASIDFAEEDVPIDVRPEVLMLLREFASELQEEVEGSKVAERVRDGFEVAILGAPNAGKSTLLNVLAGRDVAITSEIAGTTRDVIEARMDLNGLPVTFLDTAGLRESSDSVEKIGVSRAIARALAADIRVVLLTEDWMEPAELAGSIDFVFAAKDDLGVQQGVSGKTGVGVEGLKTAISCELEARVAVVRTAISERQRVGMLAAESGIDQATKMLYDGEGTELVAEHVRDAVRALDSIIGRVDVEAVLGEIFSRFCIGK